MGAPDRALRCRNQADLTVEGNQKDEAAAYENDEPHDGCAEGCENFSPRPGVSVRRQSEFGRVPTLTHRSPSRIPRADPCRPLASSGIPGRIGCAPPIAPWRPPREPGDEA